MPKQTDFSAQRRAAGRALTEFTDLLVNFCQPFASQAGINLQAHLNETAVRRAAERRNLAERLQRSVLPLFIDDERQEPSRIGTCVLVSVDSDYYIFTAAHVIRDAGPRPLWVPVSQGTKMRLMLSSSAARMTPAGNPLDVCVFLLPPTMADAFHGRVFLADGELDLDDLPDDQGIGAFYYVLGYSASRTQVQISREHRQIHQKSFHCSTGPVEPAEYVQKKISQADHILLDYDHKEIRISRKRVTPPRLQGVSGGGVFHISRDTMHGPLVAVATENPRQSRLIVATRLKHYLAAARALKAGMRH